MSTSFNFPPNPALNQIVVLPDGNSAQWNGYAWVSVADNVTYPLAVPKGGTGATNPLTAKRNLVIPIWTLDDAMPAAPVYGDRWVRPGSMTEVVWLPNANNAGVWVNLADVGSVVYPIPISKGGTGATTAAQARTNLGIDYTTQPFLLQDGTVAAPGLAWASEPGLGWYRAAASNISFASGGKAVYNLTAQAAATLLSLVPKTNGTVALNMFSAPSGSPSGLLGIGIDDAGNAYISSVGSGGGTARNLVYTAPLHTFSGGIQLPSNSIEVVSIELGRKTTADLAIIDFHAQANVDYSTRLYADPSAPEQLRLIASTTTTNFKVQGSGGGVSFENIASATGNPIGFGWRSDSMLGLRVDQVQFGSTWPINIGGRAGTATTADNSVRTNGQDRCNNWGFASGNYNRPYMRLDSTDPIRSLIFEASGNHTVTSFELLNIQAGVGADLIIYGDPGAWSVHIAASDERLKSNIVDSTVNASATVEGMRFIEFDADTYHSKLGFSAQNLQSLDAAMVIAVPQPEGSPMEHLGAVLNPNQYAILTYLAKALQETIRRVAQLEHA